MCFNRDVVEGPSRGRAGAVGAAWDGLAGVKKHSGGKNKGAGKARRRGSEGRSRPAAVMPVASRRGRSGPARAVAVHRPEIDATALGLLMAPFLIVAASLIGQQALRSLPQAIAPPVSMTQPVARPVVPPEAPPEARSLPPTVAMPAPAPAAKPRTRVMVRRPALPELALLPGPPAPREPERQPIVVPPPMALPPYAGLPKPDAGGICLARPDLDARARELIARIGPVADPARRFGLSLAAAARAQIDDLVVYNARYIRISYPRGDVPALFGVCTDVVVRAYRALGIDLQQLVQSTRSGRGDANIDHRRVEVLRTFLTRHGEVLPISDLAEDYQPGDIVTYYRPQNRSSQAHVAIVTDLIGASGRPLVVHNRGWGPQLEDALFVDRITGHYRFSALVPEAIGGATPPARDTPALPVRLGKRHAAAPAGRAAR